jgi:hypothetical protein
MPDVKRNALLPKGEENGLAAIARELVNEGTGRAAKRFRAIIAIVDCKRVNVDSDTGDEVATVRVRRAEVVLGPDLPEAEKLIRRALEFRTGQATLPLELEDELEQAFKEMQIDPDDPGADPDEPGTGTDQAQDGGA